MSRRRAERLLEPFVLTELADRPAGRLSGGEQRRLHTAIALVHRPRVVLLDEPTAGADTQTRARHPRRRARPGRATAPRSSTRRTTCPRSRSSTPAWRCSRPGGSSPPGRSSELVAQHAESVLEVTYTDGRVVRRPGASLHGLERRRDPRRGHPAVAGGRVPGADRAAERRVSIVRTELRLLRHDPVPAAVLVGMPLVLMTLLSDAMESTLATEGYRGRRRAPRRPCRAWRACSRRSRSPSSASRSSASTAGARGRGCAPRACSGRRAAARASSPCRRLLVAAQHVVLFGFGVAVPGPGGQRARGSPWC